MDRWILIHHGTKTERAEMAQLINAMQSLALDQNESIKAGSH